MLDLKRQYASIADDVKAALERVLTTQHFIGGAELEGFERELAIGIVGDIRRQNPPRINHLEIVGMERRQRHLAAGCCTRERGRRRCRHCWSGFCGLHAGRCWPQQPGAQAGAPGDHYDRSRGYPGYPRSPPRDRLRDRAGNPVEAVRALFHDKSSGNRPRFSDVPANCI